MTADPGLADAQITICSSWHGEACSLLEAVGLICSMSDPQIVWSVRDGVFGFQASQR